MRNSYPKIPDSHNAFPSHRTGKSSAFHLWEVNPRNCLHPSVQILGLEGAYHQNQGSYLSKVETFSALVDNNYRASAQNGLSRTKNTKFQRLQSEWKTYKIRYKSNGYPFLASSSIKGRCR